MNAERWRQVEEIFGRVSDLPANRQPAALERECAGDLELLAQVRTLLRHDPAGGAPIARVIGEMASVPPAQPLPFEGRTMGPYRIAREIGRGGMGVVFEAFRDDGQFEKRVALKIAAQAVYSPDFLARFKNERQILAGLEHPHIARLLDGGTTPEQIPFFAMEFVDGVPIDQYVEANRLPMAERIRLFLQVCDAVEYAHKQLVIHRDLKPGNILVADGFARLLDFGIAKLTYSEDATLTRAGHAPVTPDYCSPEQLRGEAVTARTDIYSLGLVLYKLLCGERAQKADLSSPVELEKSVCETMPALPSARAEAKGDKPVARQLRGDLDTIVMAAIEKDPSRRYLTVEAFAADLRRHLEGLPIQARQQSGWYRLKRYTRRHWVGISAAAAVIVALAAGLVSTTYQARRAERRFQQVRKIANTLVTDIYGEIRGVPASTKAQEVVVRTAVEYLDALAAESVGDPALQSEVAAGYIAIAEIEFDAGRSSLNRPEEARKYYEKAIALLDPIHLRDPGQLTVARVLVEAHAGLTANLDETGKTELAVRHCEHAVRIGEAAHSRFPSDVDLLVRLTAAYSDCLRKLYDVTDKGKFVPRLRELAEKLVALGGRSGKNLNQLAIAHSQAYKVASQEGDLESALVHARANAALQEEAVSLMPGNTIVRRNLMLAWSNVGNLAIGLGRPYSSITSSLPAPPLPPEKRKEALEAYKKGLEQARWRYERDPKSDQVRFDLAISLGRTATAFPEGDPRAIAMFQESTAIHRQLPATLLEAGFWLEAQAGLADRYRESGNLEQAQAAWRECEEIYARMLARNPNAAPRHLMTAYRDWAWEMARRKNRVTALEIARKAEEIAEKRGNNPADIRSAVLVPRARAWRAYVLELLGDEVGARPVRAETIEMWKKLADRPGVPPGLVLEAKAAIAALSAR